MENTPEMMLAHSGGVTYLYLFVTVPWFSHFSVPLFWGSQIKTPTIGIVDRGRTIGQVDGGIVRLRLCANYQQQQQQQQQQGHEDEQSNESRDQDPAIHQSGMNRFF